MNISEIKNQGIWEGFLLKQKEKTFLQSWNWGEFNKMMGSKIWRLGAYDEQGVISSAALVVKVKARRGTFLLIPHGPVGKKEILNNIFVGELKKIAKEEGCSFIRISPIWGEDEGVDDAFRRFGFKNAPTHMHPEASWKLDIRPPEKELLTGFRKTTRYLIRQAQKNKDIEIYQSEDINDIEIFNKLYREVVETQHFVPFSLNYLKNEFSAFKKDGQISLFFGKYKGKIVASAFVLFWSEIGFYHHAALLPRYHKIPVSYLLQWEAINEAKKRGCLLYDFWGFVDPKKNPKHPWAGPTLFKMGFGGEPYLYLKTQDLILSKRYWLTYIFEKLRRKKRGLSI